MRARDLNFDTIKSIDLSTEPKATAFSTFISAVVSGDIAPPRRRSPTTSNGA